MKDGLFRQYKSPRDKDSLIDFVREKTWMKVEPIPGWKSPTSLQMSIVSQFFKMSQILRVSVSIVSSGPSLSVERVSIIKAGVFDSGNSQ